MRLGICSDSHDSLDNLEKAIREFKRRGAEAIFHAGDYVAPFTVDVLKQAGCPVYGVYGNCDGERAGLANRFTEIGEIQREPHLWELNGVRIAIMHHPEWINAFARQELADIVVYGHLHELHIENRPPWVINPGEVFGRLSAGPSVVWFDTDKGEPEVIWLNNSK